MEGLLFVYTPKKKKKKEMGGIVSGHYLLMMAALVFRPPPPRGLWQDRFYAFNFRSDATCHHAPHSEIVPTST